MDRRAIYVLKMTDDNDFSSIAMDVHMHEDHLRFFDTDKGHLVIGEVIYEDEQGFNFISQGEAPGVWEFKILTIKYFKKKFYKKVTDGKYIAKTLHTTDDLHYWYRRSYYHFIESGICYKLS